MQIGAQLYTVHNHTKTLEDFSATLKKVADIGYRSVQVSGTCAYEPEWLRDELAKNNLVCAMTHIAPKRIIEETEDVVRQHAVFGCKHIGIGGMPVDMRGTLEGYNEFKKVYLPAAEKMRDLGAKLLYHNHWFEFDKLEGKDVIERILEDFPEDSIDFTLDLGWAAFADKDVLALIDMLKGRLSRIHLKDFADKPADGSIETPAYLRPIFEGKLPYEDYINALSKVGCEYMLVEQDWCYDEDEFECLKRSFENVTSRFPNVK
ncbi:MAG: sugar phosphate isomerase/epimerase [Oscillospiraceae bacterium]|nr:sugar phosphate isomerase/epimerase [Oscillospiraceae bacterium]MBQ2743817.1 sugar phosphate isomerase/epimerase [Oscillospiraceae bacterium]MBQ3225203.1 sugar phosphate isomerase/epimerase [Oscillospiraceae bacterium]